MIRRSRDWYLGRTRREQILLAAAGVISVILIAIFLIAIPLNNAIDTARDRYAEAVIRHGRIDAKVEALKGSDGAGGRAPGAPLIDFVRQSAQAAGFTLDSADAAGAGQVTIRIGSATPQAVFEWLGGLESRGVAGDNLTVDPAPNGGGTLSVGATLRSVS